MKVLVIEDNKADQRLLQEMFRDMNMPVFELVFAENLTKGIAYLDTEDIGIVLLDLGLPESQGLNTFLRLKGHAENIPVIVLTGLDDTSIALNALKEGAQDYLIKGLISPEILKKSVLYATERQRLNEELRQSNREIRLKEARFRRLIEKNADAMVVLNKKEEVQYQNPAAKLLFDGATADYLKISYVSQFDGARSIERTLDFPAGIQKIIEMRGVLIEWEQLPAFLLTIRDITERKRTEAALQVTCEWLGIALRAAHAGTWDWDIPAGELEWSPEFFDLFGLSPGADPSFETWRATLHPDDREQATASINQSIREHSYLWNEYRIILPDGQVRWIGAGGSTTYAAGDEPVRMSGVCIDITDRKLAEQALRDSEKRYRDVVEDQTEFICRFTPDGILTFVNDAYCRYFGLKQDECIGKRHSVVIPPDDLDLMKEHIRSLTHENPAGFIEHRVIMPSGEVNWQYWSDRAIFGKDDHVAEYQSVGKDITKRKAAEEALQLTLSRLESAMEAGNIAWWEMDCTTGNVSFSERKARMLGYPAEQFSHYTDFTTLLHPDDSEPAM